MDALPAAGAGWYVLDFIVGVGPASERMGAWLDENPWFVGLVFLACILVVGFVEGSA